MLTAIALVMMTPLPDLGRDPPPPPLSDLARFPDIKTTEARFRALQNQYGMLRQMPKSSERDNAMRQNEYVSDCWMMLLAAHDKDTSAKKRREYLLELNCLLGDKNYQRGQMP
jgi:hypothetical protein